MQTNKSEVTLDNCQNHYVLLYMVVISSKIITNCLLSLNCITRVDPGFETVERQEEDAAVTSLPLLDQHVILLNSLPRNVWLLPLGILAVSLRFYGPITDILQLVYGLLKNIFNSMTGMPIIIILEYILSDSHIIIVDCFD